MLNIDEIVQDIKSNNTIVDIAKKHGVSRNTIYTLLKKYGIDHQKLKFNHDFFENIDNEEKAYWLGFIMADGCVSLTQQPKVTIKLHKKDREHLEKWHRAIGSCIKIHTLLDTVSSTHYSKKMCEDLIRLGCIPRKSLKLKFPEIEKDLVWHLIRGYFDGDGCISFHNKQENIWQKRITLIGTKHFLDFIQKLFGTQNKLGTRGKAYCLSICGNKKVDKILKQMYNNCNVWLDRKKEKAIAELRLPLWSL